MPHQSRDHLRIIAQIARAQWDFPGAIAASANLISTAPDNSAAREDLETLLVEARLASEIATFENSEPIGMSSPRVTFETKVWERDWRILLQAGRLEEMITRCNYQFDERVVVINNVDDIGQVRRAADRLVASGVLTGFSVASEHAETTLSKFDIRKQDLGNGYIYSIAELVGIETCKTDFLCHFSSDSILTVNSNWISSGIDALRTNPRFVCVNPAWGLDQHAAVRQEGFAAFGEFIVGFGFSDQCYLIQADRFRRQIYGLSHYAGRRYPAYGGELFEKRVDAWMRCCGFLRLTHRHDVYRHENFV